MKTLLGPNESKSLVWNVIRDLIVLVAGILIALWAEDRWQAWQEQEIEESALIRISRDLEDDIADISGNLERATVGLDAARWIYASKNHEHLDTDELRNAIFNLGHCSILTLNTSEYVALKSSGNLRLIQDKDLLQQITSLYEGRIWMTRLHEQDCVNTKEVLQMVMPYVTHSIPPERRPGATRGWNMWDEPVIEEVVNPQGIFRDRVLINRIMAMAADRQLLIVVAESELEYAESLRESILARIVK